MRRFRRRRGAEDPALRKAQDRASGIPTRDLLSWGDQALFGIGRHLDAYRRTGSADDLAESLQGATALYAVLREVRQRSQATV